MKKLSIWHVTREYSGLAEAGGLKDVTRGLAEASHKRGHHVAVILPFYGFMTALQLSFTNTFNYNIIVGHDTIELTIYQLKLNDITIYLVKSCYYDDKDHPYLYLSSGAGHHDSFQMNIILQQSTLLLLQQMSPPTIIHLHDAHTAYLPAMAKELLARELYNKIIFIVTIHNAGISYQQRSSDIDQVANYTGISLQKLNKAIIDGEVNPFALATLDAYLTTVSPEYAISLKKGNDDETKGLSSFFNLHNIEIKGIYNGINIAEWDAASPHSGLPYRYYPMLALWCGKAKIKQWVIKKIESQQYNLPQLGHFTEANNRPLYLFHGRLVEQKGVGMLIDTLILLTNNNIAANFLIIAQGSSFYEQAISDLTDGGQNKIIFIKGYQHLLVKEAIAASDFFLLPSYFEPCGLTDLYAHMLGSLPIAHNTGGLGKIENNKTGFFMDAYDANSLADKIEEVTRLYYRDPKKIKTMARHGYVDRKKNFNWMSVTRQYYEPHYNLLCREGRL